MKTVKNKTFKKVATLALAVVMVMAAGISAFATSGDSVRLDTRLYKSDKFDPARPYMNLSMGNGIVLDATYEKRSDGKYDVTIGFDTKFKAMGITGHLTSVEIDVNGDGDYTNDGVTLAKVATGSSDAPDGAVYEVRFVQDSIPTGPKLIKGKFTSNISIVPVGLESDMVIFPAK